MEYLALVPLPFGRSFQSGMVGHGAASIAIPVLGLLGYDLIDARSFAIAPVALPVQRARILPA